MQKSMMMLVAIDTSSEDFREELERQLKASGRMWFRLQRSLYGLEGDFTEKQQQDLFEGIVQIMDQHKDQGSILVGYAPLVHHWLPDAEYIGL